MERLSLKFLDHPEWQKRESDGWPWNSDGELMLIDNPTKEASEAYQEYLTHVRQQRQLSGDY
ncbi:hypothetical protein [Lacticaseibacillus sp. N501-2]|uniref:hypothetical protein n=1 Tax=Lacticaseibacillus salsurae TaxID=3367729 RepID=UPI0038B38466